VHQPQQLATAERQVAKGRLIQHQIVDPAFAGHGANNQ